MSHEALPEIALLLNGARVDVPSPPLRSGDHVPVVVWRADNAAALLSIGYDAHDPEDPYSVDIEIYERVGERWLCVCSAGSDWPVPFGDRPTITVPTLTGFSASVRVGDSVLWASSGIAPRDVDHVRVLADGYAPLMSVEPTTGAFLVVGSTDPISRTPTLIAEV